jgi:hypothetical protein
MNSFILFISSFFVSQKGFSLLLLQGLEKNSRSSPPLHQFNLNFKEL